MRRLQFPRWEPGPELPASTLLPFLAAVGQCCSRGSEKPGTVLSHCRCCWRKPWGRARPLGAFLEGCHLPKPAPPHDTVPVSLCPDTSQACDTFQGLTSLSLGPGLGPGGFPTSLHPHPMQLRVTCSKDAAQLGTFLAIDQLLQQAGAEHTVDIFSVALQQSQACGLMTPTLVRPPGARRWGRRGAGKALCWPQTATRWRCGPWCGTGEREMQGAYGFRPRGDAPDLSARRSSTSTSTSV